MIFFSAFSGSSAMECLAYGLPRLACPTVFDCGQASSAPRSLLTPTPALSRHAVGDRGADEAGKQRVRSRGLRLELGMKLHAHKPGMLGNLDDLHQAPSGLVPTILMPAASNCGR